MYMTHNNNKSFKLRTSRPRPTKRCERQTRAWSTLWWRQNNIVWNSKYIRTPISMRKQIVIKTEDNITKNFKPSQEYKQFLHRPKIVRIHFGMNYVTTVATWKDRNYRSLHLINVEVLTRIWITLLCFIFFYIYVVSFLAYIQFLLCTFYNILTLHLFLCNVVLSPTLTLCNRLL